MSAGGHERRKWRESHSDPPWECWYCGDPISSIGQKSWSLAIHHINGSKDKKSLAPVHYSCHNELHDHSNNGHIVPVEVRNKISETLKGQKAPWVTEQNKRRWAAYYAEFRRAK